MKKYLLLACLFATFDAQAAVPAKITGALVMLKGMDIDQGEEHLVDYLAIKNDSPKTIPVDDYVSPKPVLKKISSGDALQLAFPSGAMRAKAQSYLGKPISVMCSDVSEGITAHHFTPNICTVKSISLLERKTVEPPSISIPDDLPAAPLTGDAKAENCAITANMFNVIADVRDAGRSPETALSQIQPMANGSSQYPINLQKVFVNLIFFNPAYAVPGRVLSDRQYSTCMSEHPIYQPLK